MSELEKVDVPVDGQKETEHSQHSTASVAPISGPAEEYTIVHTGKPKGKPKKRIEEEEDDDAPLVDHTAPLAKNSKKTKRLLKQQQKRQEKASSKVRNFLELPAELLQEVLGHLRPTDIIRVSQLNHATKNFIQEQEGAIAKDVMDRRYWVLRRCLPLPVYFEQVDQASKQALLNPSWQEKTAINRKPYQHIKTIDPEKVCSCPSCLLAWNNLNVVLDLAHFQWNLNHREPIPMIPRGTNPDWNIQLTDQHARIVQKAMDSPLAYAALLQTHLNTITGTLLRQTRPAGMAQKQPLHRHSKRAVPLPAKTVHPNLLYYLTEHDAMREDDEFLEREGKPSYEFPYHRDNYYNLLAYVPNRKWNKEEQRWVYYAQSFHERDLGWIRERFTPAPVSVAPQTVGEDAVSAPFVKRFAANLKT
ncbi:hypothetical protein KC318_g8445 [Hortaea werneckii]|uniref:F-box domain-containing protein n=1 Tax=Hortaea werneckii TaxID=91943 RepID=A0A3M6ZZS8_HORWE|nr:hypothetical protein KC334_g4175 [Hortaea werneckii]KAI7663180.1 hypothetical protein KC318_g8445 [Hortaea werneckii]RMY20692.1 hypothetical protein D0866_12470 [Hortaea werneckii]